MALLYGFIKCVSCQKRDKIQADYKILHQQIKFYKIKSIQPITTKNDININRCLKNDLIQLHVSVHDEKELEQFVKHYKSKICQSNITKISILEAILVIID